MGLINKLKGALGVVLMGTLATGCLTPHGNRVMRDLTYTGIQQAVVSGVRNEIEGPRGTTVNVNESRETQQLSKNVVFDKRENGKNWYKPAEGYVWNQEGNLYAGVKRFEEKLILQYYKDDNGNGKPDKNKILGNVEGPINLDNYGLIVRFKTARKGNVTYSVRDKKGNKIGSNIVNPMKINTWYSNIKKYSGDFINNLNGFSRENPGKFTFYVNQEGLDKIFKKEVTITRNSE